MPEQRIPRNSPALFNLGAHEFTVMFHDGRIEADPTRPSGLRTPLEDEMVAGFATLLSAQTMFPVLSPDEMAGHYSENDVSRAVRQGLITGEGGAWDIISGRIAGSRICGDVRERLSRDRRWPPIAFTDISNAIAAFVEHEWRSDDSAFDQHLCAARRSFRSRHEAGMHLFYGSAGCAACHSGPFQTDHGFHATGRRSSGPERPSGSRATSRDVGRMRVTNRAADAYAFRTPSLRNVARTGPWGHAGAFAELRAFLVHHLDPLAGLDRYVPQATLSDFDPARPDWTIMETPVERAAIASAASDAAARRPEVSLTDEEIDQLLAFLDSLTDEDALAGRLGIPESVPSGLPMLFGEKFPVRLVSNSMSVSEA
jgi:cytochrome c peroxidase